MFFRAWSERYLDSRKAFWLLVIKTDEMQIFIYIFVILCGKSKKRSHFVFKIFLEGDEPMGNVFCFGVGIFIPV